MSTHNIGCYEETTKIIFQLSPNIIKYASLLLLFCWKNDPLAGDDDDAKFELNLATFYNQMVRRSGSHLLHFFEGVFFVLSAESICTPNLEQIQQQLYDEHLFRK